jgi:hypothetical protein
MWDAHGDNGTMRNAAAVNETVAAFPFGRS